METLEIIIRITLVLHLLGFATILGGVLAQTKNFKTGAPVVSGILHGSWLALITGLILTGLVYANGEEGHHTSWLCSTSLQKSIVS